jgi:hypothetical protein
MKKANQSASADQQFKSFIDKLITKHRLKRSAIANLWEGRTPAALTQGLSSKSSVLASSDQKRRLLTATIVYGKTNNVAFTDAEMTEVLKRYAEYHPNAEKLGLRFRFGDLDGVINGLIEAATKQIVLLGSIPRRKLIPAFYQLLAHRLLAEKSLEISIIYDSLQSLYWRRWALLGNIDQEYATLEYSESKHKLYQNIENEIIVALRNNASDDAQYSHALKRLSISEAQVPIYTTLFDIDDCIISVPRTHLRSSMSVADILTSDEDHHWQQAKTCIQAYSETAARASLMARPKDEKIVVYSDKGRSVRGLVSRKAFNANREFETRVAHGFIFNRWGQMLLHFRDSTANDNRLLWDKSFGGNFDPRRDTSLRQTAQRELSEEVFGDFVRRLNIKGDSARDISHPPKFIDCGDWRETVAHLPETNRATWPFFQLAECTQFPTIRVYDNPVFKVERTLFADVYVFLCDDRFAAALEIAIKNNPSEKICKWVTFSELKEGQLYTTDLNNYIAGGRRRDSPDIRALLVSIEDSIKDQYHPAKK